MKLVLIYLILITSTYASPGDNLDSFQNCVSDCSNSCTSSTPNPKYPPLTKWESLLWSCYSNCDYQCQQIVLQELRDTGRPIEQFHGKWPFKRVYGIQELFSAIFSIGNLIANLISLRLFTNFYKENPHPFIFKYLLLIILSMCAWSFSTIFHIRDTAITETMDYYGAFATVLTGFYITSIRVFRLYLDRNNFKRKVFTAVCFAIYACHIYRMTVDWGYVYNMKINILFGIIQNAQVVYLTIKLYLETSNKYSLLPILLNIIIVVGMLFEVFDFFWFDLIDAHAIWHFVSIWPTVYWYQWQIWDLKGVLKQDFNLKKD